MKYALLFLSIFLGLPVAQAIASGEQNWESLRCELRLGLKSQKSLRERLQALTPRSRAYWERVSADYQSATYEQMLQELPAYREAKGLGHPQIRYLEGKGFQFEPELIAPTLISILENVENDRSQIAASDEVDPGSAFFPIWKVTMTIPSPASTGPNLIISSITSHHLPFGSELPAPGMAFITEGSVSSDLAFATRMAHQLLSIGTTDLINGSRRGAISIATHDLSHLAGLSDPAHPQVSIEYAGALQREYAAIVRAGEVPKNTDHGDRWVRMFWAVESLVIVDPEKASSIRQYLGVPADLQVETKGTSSLVENLKSFTPSELRALVTRLREDRWRYLLPLGGAVRDMVSLQAFHSGRFQFMVDFLLERLPSLTTESPPHPEDLRAIANYQKHILLLSEHTVDQLVKAAFAKSLNDLDPRTQEIFRTLIDHRPKEP